MYRPRTDQVGATGAVMMIKLMEEMSRQDDEMHLVMMCVGGPWHGNHL